ncbi:MAG: DNA recombination protein RmuC [Patescibacteria group bacterium]
MDIILVIVILGFVVLAFIFGFVIYLLLKKQQDDQIQNQSINSLGESISKMQVQLMEHLANQLSAVRGSLDNTVGKNIQRFSEEFVGVKEDLKRVGEIYQSVDNLQKIFKSPKLRGNWGEASLEHLLSQHYPKELYDLQHMFSSGERADAAFKLPDGKIIAIDAKFPLENFSKLQVVETDLEKEAIEKTFIQDVKARIDEIGQKYILPSEGTLDYAIMYVPAEAVYYEIVNPATKASKDDLISYAWSKKVIIASPNLFYLTLKTVEHWFRDVQISKQTQGILKRFERIRKDGEKLAEDFRLLGKHLGNAQSAFNNTEKRLDLMVGKVDQLTSIKVKGELEEPEGESE